ncbi:MAG: 1-deoxy-D-xylulose-5-phosphate synthase [Nitriliruptoraceae bacterium]
MLERIAAPSDLRLLGPDELAVLAGELREAVVAAVARAGGHLGSNLGIVELTIALHRVLNSPHDRIVWDTGHQAYVHKMLTGRADDFTSLRTAGGLSGYPSRAESPHDLVENSHASTALSWAAGLAWAERARPTVPPRRTVAVIGDGALTGGMAYEALNNLGHHRLPVLVVVNDNGRSYAETVSRLPQRIAELRTDPRYRRLRDRLDDVVARLPASDLAGRVRDANLRALKTAVSEAPALQSFVEALGVRYLGPFDGHDVAVVERALRDALRLDTPVLLHVLTEKGRGYGPAETDPEKRLHDTSAFDPEPGPAPAGARSWTAAFSDALAGVVERRDDVVAMTAAMPGSTGLLAVERRFPGRVIDVGIAEQHAMTSAAGLAHAGMTPVLAVYSTFFARAFDQANLDVGLHGEHVVLVLDRAGITGDDGPSHHGVLDLALALRIPGMTVLAPSCEQDLRALLDAALDLDGPVSLRFPKGTVVRADALGPRAGASLTAPLAARRLHEGADACVLAVGDRVRPAVAAAHALAAEGLGVTVWDVRSVRPADPAMLADAAAAPLVVTVENGVVAGGAGAELADRIAEVTGPTAAPPVVRLGVPGRFLPHGDAGRILADLGLDAPGIAAAVRAAVAADGRDRPTAARP